MDRTNDHLIQRKQTGHGMERNGVHLPYFDLNTILTPLFHLPSSKPEMFCVNIFYLKIEMYLPLLFHSFLFQTVFKGKCSKISWEKIIHIFVLTIPE